MQRSPFDSWHQPLLRFLTGRSLTLIILTVTVLLAAFWLSSKNNYTPVAQSAAAKGSVIAASGHILTPQQEEARQIALSNRTVQNLFTSNDVELLAVDPVAPSEAAAQGYERCLESSCSLVTVYNYTKGGVISIVVNHEDEAIVALLQDELARPRATALLIEKALTIAGTDNEVTALLGDVAQLEVAMAPISIWLADSSCGRDWCIDLTFDSPANDGRVLHVTINMEEESVARLFYTRSRDTAGSRLAQTDGEQEAEETPAPLPTIDPDLGLDPSSPRFTNGCKEQFGWSVCWEMTAHDGLNFFDATFEEQLIFSSSKISQVEVYYAAWPGGYRDEIGFNASVLPKFDTRVTEFDNGFEVRQMFTEEFAWPTCVCCYRYEQIIHFYDDGSFEKRFISYGPGCDDLSVYRPFWRTDIELNQPEDNNVWAWQNERWEEVDSELDMQLFDSLSEDGEIIATFTDDLHYRWLPVLTDPLGQDEGRLFVLTARASEGAGPIEAGPADTFTPPRQWVDEEAVSGNNAVIWYIPFLKTKKASPWYCMPEPMPSISPCEAILRVVPAGALIQPDPTATPAPDASPTISSTTQATAPTVAPTATLQPLAGDTAEEIILNAGCGACHVIGVLGEAGKVGPDLSDIGSVAGERVAGLSAEEYLRQSMLAPNDYIVADCPNGPCATGAMPTYSDRLTEQQVDTLISFLLVEQSLDPKEEDTGAESATTSNPTPQPTQQPIVVDDANDGSNNVAMIIAAALVTIVALFGGVQFVRSRRQKDLEESD